MKEINMSLLLSAPVFLYGCKDFLAVLEHRVKQNLSLLHRVKYFKITFISD